MEVFGSDRKLSELDAENDLSDLLDNDYYSADILQHGNDMALGSYSMDNDNWLDSFFENDVILNDKMMSEAMQPPHIKSEHSYSMTNSESDPESPLNLSMEKMDSILGKDMDNEIFKTYPSGTSLMTTAAKLQPSQQKQVVHTTTHHTVTTTTGALNHIIIKQEPLDTDTQQHTQMYIDQPTIVLTTQQIVPNSQIELSNINLKTETDVYDQIDPTALEELPPTPPSSSSSDSEGGQSPRRSAPSSPQHTLHTVPHQTMRTFSQSIFSSPIPQSGILVLTEEERRTLISEGYSVPNKLPLTKQEEKNLKKVRRKIKNKISAQESRRKKKEYLETLEKRMEVYSQENNDLRKKVDTLESNNRSLVSQLQKLQALVGRITKPSSPSTAQTGTCLMVLALCFAVFLGGWSPSSMSIGYRSLTPSAVPASAPKAPMGPPPREVRVDDYSTPNMRSRVLLSVKEDLEESHTEPFRPMLPFSCSEMLKQFWNVISGKPKASTSKDTIEDPSNSSLSELLKPSSGILLEKNRVNISSVRIKQASMHPDIAANITYLEPFVNATA